MTKAELLKLENGIEITGLDRKDDIENRIKLFNLCIEAPKNYSDLELDKINKAFNDIVKTVDQDLTSYKILSCKPRFVPEIGRMCIDIYLEVG